MCVRAFTKPRCMFIARLTMTKLAIGIGMGSLYVNIMQIYLLFVICLHTIGLNAKSTNMGDEKSTD